MQASTPFARYVSSLLPNAIKGGYAHRALVGFNIGVMHAYILGCGVLDEGVMTLVVSALMDVLKDGEDVNLIVGFPHSTVRLYSDLYLVGI